MAKKKKKSKKTQEKKSSGAWLLLLIVLLGGAGAYLYFKPAKVLVPALVGKGQAEAAEALDRLNLKAEVKSEKVEDEAVRPGQVLRQSPAAETAVPTRSVVTLYIAEVPEGVEVPEVVGKTRSEAEDVLRRAGFAVTFSEATSDAVDVGRVISQNPAPPAKVKRGQAVNLTISGGRGKQSVPNLQTLTPDVARQRLSKLGLEISVMQVAQAGFRAGDKVTVLRQEPQPGSKLPVGSRVTVFVPIPAPAINPPTDPNQVVRHAPRLEGLTVSEAQDLAKSENVTLEFADSAEASSVITFQDPPAGDPLDQDVPAVLVRTAQSAVVPGLAGLSVEEARTKIERAELTLGSIKKTYGPVAGEVLGQRPSAGIEILGGSPVDLVVADPGMAPDSAQNPAPLPTPAFTPAPWVE